MQFPLSKTASQGILHPSEGMAMRSPGTRSVVLMSSKTLFPLQTVTVSSVNTVPFRFF